MTPNIGQGANTAIEDVAVLASLLNRVIHADALHKPSGSCMEMMLQEYKTLRYERAKSTYERSRFGARFHTRDNWLKALVGRYVFQYVGGLIENRTSKALAGGNIIDFLPRPNRLESGCVTHFHKGQKRTQRQWTLLWVSSLALFLFYPWIRSYLHSTTFW